MFRATRQQLSHERDHADLRTLLTLDNLDADACAFWQFGHPGLLEHGAMQEQLLTATIRRDETKAFRYVVPLDDPRALPRAWRSLLGRRALRTLLLLFVR